MSKTRPWAGCHQPVAGLRADWYDIYRPGTFSGSYTGSLPLFLWSQNDGAGANGPFGHDRVVTRAGPAALRYSILGPRLRLRMVRLHSADRRAGISVSSCASPIWHPCLLAPLRAALGNVVLVCVEGIHWLDGTERGGRRQHWRAAMMNLSQPTPVGRRTYRMGRGLSHRRRN